MVSIPGVDYPWSHPGGAALQAAGIEFACRYLSHDTGKNLSRAEADDLAAHGVWCVVVWESTANRALSGRSGGITDAQTALAQATAYGMPSGRPVYFATDWDVTPAQQAAVNAYLDGAGSVLGRGRIGVYGGYYAVKRALDGGHAALGWQTFAWSGGQWDPRAAIRQGNQKKINGVSVDLDTALVPDYGQWMPNKIPAEDDMTPEQAKQLKELHDLLVPFAGWGYKGGGETHDAYSYLRGTSSNVGSLMTKVNSLEQKVDGYAAAQKTALSGLLTEVQALRSSVTDPSGLLARLEDQLQSYVIKFEKES
jgi:hypothetical protein